MFCIGVYLTQLEAIGAMPESAMLSPATAQPAPSSRDWRRLAALMLGYAGVYLCRKNFAVAIPLIGQSLSLNKAQIGAVASASTAAYMAGKFIFGPIIDRVGGRTRVPGHHSSPSPRLARWGERRGLAGRAHALL